MTRFKTYQMEWGFVTVDSQTEQPPEGYIAGPFDVTIDEADLIKDGASIEVVGDEVQVIVEGEPS